MNRKLVLALVPAALLLASAAAAQADAERARKNAMDVIAGRTQAWQLPPAEQSELIALARELKEKGENEPDTRARCIERNRTKHPTELELAILELKCSQRR